MKRHTRHAMPSRRHIPGSGSVPDKAVLDTAKADRAEAFAYGADLFNHGFFWEAHEVWEAVWMAAPPNSARREALRMLIQMANACLKLVMGKLNAFHRLAEEIAGIAPGEGLAAEGLDTTTLASRFQRFATNVAGEIGGLEAPDAHSDFPFIMLEADQEMSGDSM